MDIPVDAPQLLIVVTFVLPGIVYQTMRSRLRGPTPDQLDATSRILRATAVSTFLALVHLVVFGSSLLDSADGTGWLAEHVRWSALLAAGLVFGVPVLLALAERRIYLADVVPKLLGDLVMYDPTPTAWDHKFRAWLPTGRSSGCSPATAGGSAAGSRARPTRLRSPSRANCSSESSTG